MRGSQLIKDRARRMPIEMVETKALGEEVKALDLTGDNARLNKLIGEPITGIGTKAPYLKPTVKSVPFGPWTPIGSRGEFVDTSFGTFFFKKRVDGREMQIINMLIEAGVSVEEPLFYKGRGLPVFLEGLLEYIELIEKKGEAIFFGKGMQLTNILKTLNWGQRRKVLKRVAVELVKMHKAGVFHRDFHANNVVVDPDTLNVSIIDFEISRVIGTKRGANIRTDFDDSKRGRFAYFGDTRFDIINFFVVASEFHNLFVNRGEALFFLNEIVKAYRLPETKSKELYDGLFSLLSGWFSLVPVR